MAFPGPSTAPSQQFQQAAFAGLTSPGGTPLRRADEAQFDIFEWYPNYQSCQRYFLDHAQHNAPVQAVAAFLNICLPNQRHPFPINHFASAVPSQPGMGIGLPSRPGGLSSPYESQTDWVSLYPYLRRLVATGLDLPGVLHGFFGDDWRKGVGPLHEQERRNYLFAAKSGGWAAVKKDYDLSPLETVPFLRPLQDTMDVEIQAAEKTWSEWLAMEDWMVGPRAPENMEDTPSHRGKSHGR